MKILLAEDNLVVLELLKNLLIRQEHHVFPAINGKEALQLAEQTQAGFDVIITDVQMPFVDGIELMQQIHKYWRKIPTIIITANILMNEDDWKQLGAVAYLPKPIDQNMLIKILNIIKPDA